jgi:hypothetical protein
MTRGKAAASAVYILSDMKKFLFILWLAVSAFWAWGTAHQWRVMQAVNDYGNYYQLIDDINDGTATAYEKKEYMEYGPRLEAAGSNFAIFILLGLGLPCVALWAGAKLLEAQKKTTAGK